MEVEGGGGLIANGVGKGSTIGRIGFVWTGNGNGMEEVEPSSFGLIGMNGGIDSSSFLHRRSYSFSMPSMSRAACLAKSNVFGFLSNMALMVELLQNPWIKNCLNVSSLSIVPTNLVHTNSNLRM
jgi:hypothetical protein